jgi:flagellar basal-body rod protein FlgF
MAYRQYATNGAVSQVMREAVMPYGLYLSAEGAQAQSTRLEIIANNLANVDTVGFKRELAILQARYAEAIEEGVSAPGSGAIDDVGGGIMVRETKTDYSPGPLRRTEQPTDVAIQGQGFFLVRKGDETFLTRAGNFSLNSGGELITQQGYAVLDDAGAPVVVTDTRWDISDSGVVRQRSGAQNLAIVRPQSLGDLVRVGENLFRPLSDPQPVAAADRGVRVGYLEMSSVQPMTEMTEMIQASRALEANVNMMKVQDEMLSGLVNRVMKA